MPAAAGYGYYTSMENKARIFFLNLDIILAHYFSLVICLFTTFLESMKYNVIHASGLKAQLNHKQI